MIWTVAASGVAIALVALALSKWNARRERAAFVATLSTDAHNRLRGFEMVSDWRAFREIEARHAEPK